jgi:hypothetical protein
MSEFEVAVEEKVVVEAEAAEESDNGDDGEDEDSEE